MSLVIRLYNIKLEESQNFGKFSAKMGSFLARAHNTIICRIWTIDVPQSVQDWVPTTPELFQNLFRVKILDGHPKSSLSFSFGIRGQKFLLKRRLPIMLSLFVRNDRSMVIYNIPDCRWGTHGLSYPDVTRSYKLPRRYNFCYKKSLINPDLYVDNLRCSFKVI